MTCSNHIKRISKVVFLLILLSLFFLEGNAQPIGGFVKVKIDDGLDREVTCQVTIVYADDIQPIDDSLNYFVNSRLQEKSLKKICFSSKTREVDSSTTLEYLVPFPISFDFSISWDFYYLFKDKNNQLDTLKLYAIFDVASEGFFTSVDYLPSIVYHHPAQELSIGFLKQQVLYNWPDLPLYNYGWAGYSKPQYGIRVLKETGNVVADKNVIKSSFGFDMTNNVRSKYLYRYNSSLHAYIVVDSTLTGYFSYDGNYKNASGFINVLCETGKEAQFNFDYIDSDADSVVVECYYSNAHFGSSISYTTLKRNDTLSVSLNKLITEDIYKQLPQPINFIVYPYKNKQTKPRYFSFNLVKDFNTGLSSVATFDTSKIQLYPNPTNGFLNIKGSEQIASIKFINMLGQVVLSYIKPENQLNVEELKSGMYWVELIDDKKNVSYTKILKE